MFSFCSPINTLMDYIELGHFDNVPFSVCSILQCMHQREIATCRLMHSWLANTPLVVLESLPLTFLDAASAA